MKSFNYKIVGIIIFCFLLIVPYILSIYTQILFTEIFIMGLFALSFNLLFGYTGLLSFGQAAFFGLGGYAAAFILRDIYPCIWLALFGGLVLGFISSALIGYFSVKLDEIYFAMLTLGFGMMFFTLVHQWRSFTGGSDGISGFPMPVLTLFIKKFELSNPRIYYYFSLFITTIASYILYRIIKSPFGLILLSIKENSERVSFTGINVRFYRWLSFVFAGTFAGLAGSLFSVFDRIASPTMLHWTKSAEPVLMTILGGANIFFGPFLGAAVFFFLEDIITKYTQSWMIFLGFILLFLVILFPEGILGSIIKFLKKEDNER